MQACLAGMGTHRLAMCVCDDSGLSHAAILSSPHQQYNSRQSSSLHTPASHIAVLACSRFRLR